jgi:hypothetical protein
MAGPIFLTPSPDELTQQTASRSDPQGSDPAYLVSVGVIAIVIIGLFFGVGFFLLAQTTEQIIGGLGPRDRGTEVKALQAVGFPDLSSEGQSVPVQVELPPSAAVTSLSVLAAAQSPTAREEISPENTSLARSSAYPAVEAALSPATSAPARAEAPTARSAASQATRGPSAAVPASEPASNRPVATAPAVPSASPLLAAEVADLLARGDSFVLIGDVASARVFYERAANAGDGRAAVRMGATFDPVFLRRAGLHNTIGDPAQARSWYHRALDLGSVEARALVKGTQ